MPQCLKLTQQRGLIPVRFDPLKLNLNKLNYASAKCLLHLSRCAFLIVKMHTEQNTHPPSPLPHTPPSPINLLGPILYKFSTWVTRHFPG